MVNASDRGAAIKAALQLSCVYIGTVIGAGFASGQEIWRFFVRYQPYGLFGVLFGGVLFFIVGYAALRRISVTGAADMPAFFEGLLPKTFIRILRVVMYAAMYASFCVMCAGCGALLNQQWDMPVMLGTLFCCAVCFTVFLFNMDGLARFNMIATPLLIVGILATGVDAMRDAVTAYVVDGGGSALQYVNNWYFSGILYASYNTLSIVPVFAGLSPLLRRRNTPVAVAGISAVTLIGLCVLLYIILALSPDAVVFDIPMLHIAKYRAFYTLVLLCAMLTTAVSAGFGLLGGVRHNKMLAQTALVASAVPVSLLGFSGLVATLYPFFGYVGIFVMIVTIIGGFINLRK